MKTGWLGIVALTVFAGIQMGGATMEFEDIPAAAPDDTVMAGPEELGDMMDWGSMVFSGERLSQRPAPVRIEVRRQDHNVLRFGESCMETPLRIGARDFDHGLGTHANSELLVAVPPGAKQFHAFAGIDNNYSTEGVRGSVEFSVEIDGKEIVRTPTLRGSDEAYLVEVDIPEGATHIVLKVDTTPDGPGHDQADWADACFVLGDGARVWLDDRQWNRLLTLGGPPFSFVYDGVPSADLLKTWTLEREMKDGEAAIEHTVRWTDPKTSLRVSATVRVFKKYPAVDWVLRFENQGTADTPIIENIQALDLLLRTGNAKTPVIVRHNRGDHCGEESFRIVETAIEPGPGLRMAPEGGRSSNGAFPFFDMRYGDDILTAAVGWSGQWAASIQREGNGPTRVRAGMELTHLVLHPGESIRSPRILLSLSRSDIETAHNRFRRLLLFHYIPQVKGRPAQLPVALQTFDRYSWSRPEWATEAGQKNAVNVAHEIGFDSYWFDAAWFVGGFPNGVGNWYPKPDAFPNGLKPVADECHRYDMRFILWVEPERVAKGTQIAKEHPKFVFGGEKGGLFKLNDPDARKWLTELLSKIIADFDLDFYRNDFNIDPLSFWRANDTPDRQGITEIRYIEGLYEMWDTFRAQKPGLLIDNCASGGRRIDLETCTRSVPLWRSDTNCSPSHNDWNQAQGIGMSSYIPLSTACAWTPDPYEVRSAATGGLLCQWAYLDEGFPFEDAKRILAEAKDNQKYWYGDFYALTTQSITDDAWCAYQLHRPDLNAGIVIVFRRMNSNYTGLDVALRGLVPGQTYTIEYGGSEAKPEEMSAEKLSAGVELRLPQKGSSQIIRYKAVGPPSS